MIRSGNHIIKLFFWLWAGMICGLTFGNLIVSFWRDYIPDSLIAGFTRNSHLGFQLYLVTSGMLGTITGMILLASYRAKVLPLRMKFWQYCLFKYANLLDLYTTILYMLWGILVSLLSVIPFKLLIGIFVGLFISHMVNHKRTTTFRVLRGILSLTLVLLFINLYIVFGNLLFLNRDFTLLHSMSLLGCPKVVHLLIKSNFNIDAQDYQDVTPLHIAAFNNHIQVIEVLIESGADIDITDQWGRTALHWSAQNGTTGAINLLVQARANINLQDSQGLTPLEIAASNGYADIVNVLLQATEAPGIVGTQLLFRAVYDDWYDLTKVLLEAGADVRVIPMKDKEIRPKIRKLLQQFKEVG